MATNDPVTDPNQLEDTYNQIGQQLNDLNQRYIDLQTTHSQDKRMDFGGPAAHAANRQYNAARLAIDAQRQALKNQQSILQQNYGRLARSQHQQEAQRVAQEKAQVAAQKYQEEQRKTALTETQKKLAGILGVKPDQVDDKLGDAKYDPITHKLIVPTKPKAEVRADEKDRDKSIKDFNEKIKDGYSVEDLGTGKKTNVLPGNIFGPRSLPYKEGDGKRVYMLNGKPYAIIPSDEFEGLKKEYDDINTRPVTDGKMVDPDLYNAARDRIAALGGDVPEDIVGKTQALVEARRLAQPALNPQMGFAPGLLPNQRMIQATQVPASTEPNSYPPISLPAAIAGNIPALTDPRQNIAVTQDASGRISAAYDPTTDITLPNITSRLPAQVRSVPELQTAAGTLPAITLNQPAATATIPFQNNILGQDVAVPSLQSTMENRLEAFRPGYEHQPTSQDIVDKKIDDAAARWGVPREKAAAVFKRVGDLNPKDSNEFNSLVEAGIGALPEVANRGILDQLRASPTVQNAAASIGNLTGNPMFGSKYGSAYGRALDRAEAPIANALTPDMYNNPDLLESAMKLQKAKGYIPDNTTLKQFVADRINSDQEMADAAAQEPMY